VDASNSIDENGVALKKIKLFKSRSNLLPYV